MKKKFIIAHRGDTSSEVENTTEAFQNAIRKGADMIEFDVRRTSDGHLIVHHDQTIHQKLIKNMRWESIELANRRRNFEVPKLEDVLQAVKGKIKLDIEIKEASYEKKVIETILRFFDPKDFIITSFNDTSLKEIKRLFPGVRTGLLLGERMSKKKAAFSLTELLSNKKYRRTSADFFVPHSLLVQLGFLKRVEKYDKPSIVWAANSEKIMQKMLRDERVAGIITDKLDMALKAKAALRK